MQRARVSWVVALILASIPSEGWGREKEDEKPEPIADPQLMVDAKGFAGVPVRALAISSDGRWLAAGGGKQVRLWDLKTGQLQGSLRGYQEPLGYLVGTINSVLFTADARFLLVGVSDNTMAGSTRVYDLRYLDTIHRLIRGHSGCTLGMAFSPDGAYMATWGCGGHIIIYRVNVEAGDMEVVVDVTKAFGDRQVGGLNPEYFGFPLDNNWLVWKDKQSDLEIVVSRRDEKIVEQRSDWPDPVRFVLDNTRQIAPRWADVEGSWTTPAWLKFGADLWYARGGVAAAPGKDPLFWIAAWRPHASTPRTVYREHRFHPTAVAVNPSTETAASADAFGDVHVWNVRTGQPLYRFQSNNQEIYRVAWSERGDGLLYSDQPYAQETYNCNRFGPINRQFRLERRHIGPGEPKPDDPVTPERWDAVHGAQVSLVPHAEEDPSGLSAAASLDSPFSLELKAGQTVLGRFPTPPQEGRPYAFKFAEWAPQDSGRLPFYAGYSKGALVLARLLMPDESRIGPAFAPPRSGPVPRSKPPAASDESDSPRGRNGKPAQASLVVTHELRGHTNAITSISESPNGRFLATSSIDGTIRLWSLKHLQSAGDLDCTLDRNRVTAVPDGSLAKAAGLEPEDEILSINGLPFYERLRQMAKGKFRAGQKVALELKRDGRTITATAQLAPRAEIVEPTLNLFVSRDGEWVVWTPQGYYDASSRGGEYVGWHVNQGRPDPARFYPVSQFQKRLYRPDVIDAVLRTGDAEQGTRQANEAIAHLAARPIAELDLRDRESFEAVRPPEVRLEGPIPGTAEGDSVTLVAEVTCPPRQTIRELDVRVNGRPAGVRSTVEGSEERPDARRTRYRQTVTLAPGKNTISIRAVGSQSVSRAEEVVVTRSSPSILVSMPNLYVLAIGVAEHKDPRFRLEFADRDATAFADAWKKQEGKLYHKVETRVVTNKDATQGNILDAMDWLKNNATDRRDTALVLISGHGVFDNRGNWYLGTHELDTEHLSRTTISHAQFTNWMDTALTANTVLFVDTCHAGAMRGRKSVRVESPQGLNLWQGAGTLLLAACLPKETSLEDQAWGHGAFTKAILTALEGRAGDLNADRRLTFDELEVFVKAEVVRLTGGRQHPAANKPPTVSNVELAELP